MTDITDIHRLAYERVEVIRDMPSFAEAWAEVRKLLPPELTNPQPVLPTEPGHYQDEQGRHWLHQVYGPKSEPYHVDQWLDWNGQNGAPPTGKLTRLVPERPQITDSEINEAWANAREDESIQRHRDGSMSAVGAFHAGFRAAITNGANRD